MVRQAYTLRKDDDDYSQAGVMVREVLNDEQRARLVGNVAGHLLGGVSEPILLRAFEYWKNIDKELGDKIEQAVRNGGS
jgi:catalase